MAIKEMLCTNCGYQGWPRTITKGNFGTELLLWLLFLLPGLIYLCWRHISRYEGCPECEAIMIPIDSPVARKFIKELP